MSFRTNPEAKAHDLVRRYGTVQLAMTFAEDTRNQHDPDHLSFRYWQAVIGHLRRYKPRS